MNRYKLMSDLVKVFNDHGMTVSVGVTDYGVAIRSSDERVDAYNLYFSVKPTFADAYAPRSIGQELSGD